MEEGKELSWGDLVEQWLKEQQHNKAEGLTLEVLLSENPSLSVIRDPEGDISTWTDLPSGDKRVVIISKRTRSSFSGDTIITSYRLRGEGQIPEYTYIKAEYGKYLKDSQVYSTEIELIGSEILRQAKLGLEVLQLQQKAPEDLKERFKDRVQDFIHDQSRKSHNMYLNQNLLLLESNLGELK